MFNIYIFNKNCKGTMASYTSLLADPSRYRDKEGLGALHGWRGCESAMEERSPMAEGRHREPRSFSPYAYEREGGGVWGCSCVGLLIRVEPPVHIQFLYVPEAEMFLYSPRPIQCLPKPLSPLPNPFFRSKSYSFQWDSQVSACTTLTSCG